MAPPVRQVLVTSGGCHAGMMSEFLVLMMAAVAATSPHKLCVMHPSLCAVCAYVHVCVWLDMSGV